MRFQGQGFRRCGLRHVTTQPIIVAVSDGGLGKMGDMAPRQSKSPRLLRRGFRVARIPGQLERTDGHVPTDSN